jgi:hypothetical protein
VVAVDIIVTAQEAEARGCKTSTAVNASKGRCFQSGPASELTSADDNEEENNNEEKEE